MKVSVGVFLGCHLGIYARFRDVFSFMVSFFSFAFLPCIFLLQWVKRKFLQVLQDFLYGSVRMSVKVFLNLIFV